MIHSNVGLVSLLSLKGLSLMQLLKGLTSQSSHYEMPELSAHTG